MEVQVRKSSDELNITEGSEAFKLYVRGVQSQFNVSKAHDHVTNPCFAQAQGVDSAIHEQIQTMYQAYDKGTEESVTRAVKEELPKLNQIMFEYGQTLCGRTVLHSHITEQFSKANEKLRIADVQVSKSETGRVTVSIDGGHTDLTHGLNVLGEHAEHIEMAKISGSFQPSYVQNSWDNAGRDHAVILLTINNSSKPSGVSETIIYVLVVFGIALLMLNLYALYNWNQKRKQAKVERATEHEEM